MRPQYLPSNARRERVPSVAGTALSGLAFLLLVILYLIHTASFAHGQTPQAAQDPATGDPMTSAQALEVREAYRKCHALDSPVGRYFCICEVVEQQCLDARHPSHGDWRTVEVWASDDERDRAVYFHLAQDELSATVFDPPAQTVIVSCMRGNTAVVVHLGDEVDAVEPVEFIAGGTPIPVDLEDLDEGGVAAVARDGLRARDGLVEDTFVTLRYTDYYAEAHEVSFDTDGLAAAMQGWEPVCSPPDA